MTSQNVNNTSCKAVISQEFLGALWIHWHKTGGSYTRPHIPLPQLMQFTIFLDDCSQKLARLATSRV